MEIETAAATQNIPLGARRRRDGTDRMPCDWADQAPTHGDIYADRGTANRAMRRRPAGARTLR
jgi:hypothetical protein